MERNMQRNASPVSKALESARARFERMREAFDSLGEALDRFQTSLDDAEETLDLISEHVDMFEASDFDGTEAELGDRIALAFSGIDTEALDMLDGASADLRESIQ